MKARLRFLFFYIAFWLLIFILTKIAFLLYQHHESFTLPVIDWFRIVFHGFKLDVSATGYILLLPSFILAATSYLNWKTFYYSITIYTGIVLVVILVLTLVDLEIYKYWGIRMDKDPLRFLATPAETLASSTLLSIVIFVFAFLLTTCVLFFIYLKRIGSQIKHVVPAGWQGTVFFALFTGLLILPIRGGTGVTVISTGSVYFHEKAFANQAAINVLWNFGQSLIEKKESENPFIYYTDDRYKQRLKELYVSNDSSRSVLKTTRPNIILVILESFTAKVIEPLGGELGVTPAFNEMAEEGVLFSNIYSTDSRTDKGLASIISGYPVVEAVPILRYPEKSARLPFISSDLIREGYHATFSYGGEIDFVNMRSYLVSGNFHEILSDGHYPKSERSGKWGIPDHIIFERFYEEVLQEEGRPFFKVLMTLSNHEPFIVPGTPKFGNDNLRQKFLSSAYYADSCLGTFIQKMKRTELWDDLLIVLVADHGARPPDYSENHDPRKYHIPLLWIGGAVMQDTVVTKFGSQADFAVTLLRQMNIETGDYILGKDLLDPSSQSFAFYSYKNGIGMLTDTAGFGLDFISDDLIFSFGKVDGTLVSYAKTMQQFVFDSYLNLTDSDNTHQ